MLLALVVLGTGLGLARFAVPYALLGVRGLARLTRQLAGDWCGVPIPERYTPRPDEALTVTGRLTWLAMDPATRRDLLWTVANPVACSLAALPAAIIATGLIEFIGPELTREIPPPAFPGNAAGTLIVLGLAIASTGVLAAPALLRAYGLLARSMLTPDGEAELASRVRQLTADPRRTPSTPPPPSSAGSSGTCTTAPRPGWWPWAWTLGAAGHAPRHRPGEAARAAPRPRPGTSSVDALAELRALVRGIHPPVLAERGLGRRRPRRWPCGRPRAHRPGQSSWTGRPPAPVESAAYFAVSELLANAVQARRAPGPHLGRPASRHSGRGMLRIAVTDNGHGGAEPAGAPVCAASSGGWPPSTESSRSAARPAARPRSPWRSLARCHRRRPRPVA